MVCVNGEGTAAGLGLTVITTSKGIPEHEFAVGVTVNVAVPGTAAVVVSTIARLLPDPADAPLTLF
jgi:hypothetical protein